MPWTPAPVISPAHSLDEHGPVLQVWPGNSAVLLGELGQGRAQGGTCHFVPFWRLVTSLLHADCSCHCPFVSGYQSSQQCLPSFPPWLVHPGNGENQISRPPINRSPKAPSPFSFLPSSHPQGFSITSPAILIHQHLVFSFTTIYQTV